MSLRESFHRSSSRPCSVKSITSPTFGGVVELAQRDHALHARADLDETRRRP
jgi:hypothetical protein